MAKKLNIQLFYVPAGMTDIYQPCDVRVFGALKAKARSAWYQLIYRDKNFRATKKIKNMKSASFLTLINLKL